jgi:hypothetical protein
MSQVEGFKKINLNLPIIQIVLLSASLTLLSFACKDNPTKSQQRQIQLILEDTSCTEVWFKLQLGTDVSERTVTLKRDEVELWTRSIDATETTITDTNLIPGHTYTYTARLISPPPIWAGGNSTTQVQVRTMDTTSHNFTWRTFTLGDGTGSSVLYDVAIINDTCAWAIGEIHRNDTTFNAAKWDGTQWYIQQLNYQGSPPVIKTIFAFNEQDIWFDPWLHWNGQSIQEIPIDPILIGVGVNKMWGSPTGELFVIGTNGFIARRSASGTWMKLESGTTNTIQDIWGKYDSQTGIRNILCGVAAAYSVGNAAILSISENNIINSVPCVSGRRPYSVWFENITEIYTCGDGVFRRDLNLRWREIAGNDVIPVFTNKLRGQAENDIFIVGDYGTVAHYNGITFRIFQEVGETLNNTGIFFSCDYRAGFFIAVGTQSGSKAIILKMNR